MTQLLALAGPAVLTGDSEIYSLTGISTVSSSSTRHSCRAMNARNSAASCDGGLSKSVSRHFTITGDIHALQPGQYSRAHVIQVVL